MSNFVVDCESDGPIPNLYSLVCFGAVKVEDLSNTFYGKVKPISDNYLPEALAISGFTREEHLLFDDPKTVMTNFIKWVESSNSNGRPIFWSDNPAYDWQFINYYTHYYCGKNPFGFSARRIGDLACGLFKDLRYKWKHLRKTKHTHNPVDDSIGNAEALIELIKKIEA